MSTILEQARFSCAMAAQQSVLAIPGALPIVHAGPGCSSKAYRGVGMSAGYQGEGFAGGSAVTSTNTLEQDVVFGGENKLRSTIEGALKVLDAELFVVLSGCTSDIVGDDSIHVAREFRREGHPVIGTETAGFKGNNYLGHEIVEKAIINEFVGDVTPNVRKGLVNVFSVVPYQDPFWRGDLQEIKALLEKLGLEVNILFGYESKGVAEWKDIPNAEFNIVISPWVGVSVAELLQKKYGTPYLHYPILPVGALETGKFLRTVGAFVHLPEETVEAVIQREEDIYYQYVIAAADMITDLRNNMPHELYTVADSVYALGVSSFLTNEFGFIPQTVFITDDAQGKNSRLVEEAAASLGEDFEGIVIQEPDGGLVERALRDKFAKVSKRVLILGSTWEKILSEENSRLQHIFLSYPISGGLVMNHTYVGYRGGLQLVEDIYNGSFNRSGISRNTLTTLDE